MKRTQFPFLLTQKTHKLLETTEAIPWMTEKLSTAYVRVLNSADPKLEENMHWKKLINIVLHNSKANTVCSAWNIKIAHTHTKVKAEGKVVPVTV